MQKTHIHIMILDDNQILRHKDTIDIEAGHRSVTRIYDTSELSPWPICNEK